MRLAILGSGALGSLFAAYLSSQINLVLLGHWPAQMNHLRKSALTMIQNDGNLSHHHFPVAEDASSVSTVDIVLILVKSYQTLRAAKEAKSLLAPEGLAITLQNGLGNREILRKSIGPDRVEQGVTSLGATMIEPGVVRHAGLGKIHLAKSVRNSTLIERFKNLINASGLDCETTEDVDSLVWGKLAVNTGINPLTALLRVPNGYLVENEIARSLMIAASEETATVANSIGIELPFSDVGQHVVDVAQKTAQNYSSMLQDILRNSPTEIEAICGEVVRHGHNSGVSVPLNEEFLRLLSLQQSHNANDHLTSKISELNILLSA